MSRVNDVIDKMKDNTVSNYILPGLSSSILSNGVVRLFENSRLNEGFITPHSHRFDFACYVLQGSIEQILYRHVINSFSDGVPLFNVKKQVGNYKDGYQIIDEEKIYPYAHSIKKYEIGQWYTMKHNEIHSIRFSERASVLFFEGPNITDTVTILEPHVDGKIVPIFKQEDWMFRKI